MSVEFESQPSRKDLGGFLVTRVLPQAKMRAVGPFVFFDHMGPADLPPGKGMDVRPHPHIGLATVTYLYSGSILHKDSLGSQQIIKPGDVNWMIAGRGIVHSERTDEVTREKGSRMNGLQVWIGLPLKHEDTEPQFSHYPADQIPTFSKEGVKLTLIAGESMGERSPVTVFSRMFYLDAIFPPASKLTLPTSNMQRGMYVVEGEVKVGNSRVAEGMFVTFTQKLEIQIRTTSGARIALFGGDPLDGPRHVWWNFVASSRDRIERAKKDWKEGRFGQVPGETEFIPLPAR
jgi:redox-sensitive bicupin YhaK (pirin superfamily)